jgi:hypothetical protein
MSAAAANSVALNPGESKRGVLDFSKGDDLKFQKQMTKESDIKFGGQSIGVNTFMTRVSTRASVGGMDRMFKVPDPITGNP